MHEEQTSKLPGDPDLGAAGEPVLSSAVVRRELAEMLDQMKAEIDRLNGYDIDGIDVQLKRHDEAIRLLLWMTGRMALLLSRDEAPNDSSSPTGSPEAAHE